MAIKLECNGLKKDAPTGFAWLSLFFGVFNPLFRGDTQGLINQLIIVFFTGGIAWIVIPFTYHRRYIKRLIEKGYTPADEKAEKYISKL
tara:strand:+ start:845 stop:1111 length:267 start_codon:yes stop_codon:yes gene_type:complete